MLWVTPGGNEDRGAEGNETGPYAAGANVYEQTSDHIVIQGIFHLGQSFSSCSSISYQLQMKSNINKQQHQPYCDPLLLK